MNGTVSYPSNKNSIDNILSGEQIQLIASIDREVHLILENGGDDEELLEILHDRVDKVNIILQPEYRNAITKICADYAGFHWLLHLIHSTTTTPANQPSFGSKDMHEC